MLFCFSLQISNEYVKLVSWMFGLLFVVVSSNLPLVTFSGQVVEKHRTRRFFVPG